MSDRDCPDTCADCFGPLDAHSGLVQTERNPPVYDWLCRRCVVNRQIAAERRERDAALYG